MADLHSIMRASLSRMPANLLLQLAAELSVTVEELRAERVELQGENEALRHDLNKVQTEKDELEHDLKRVQREAAWWGSRLWLMGAKTPVPDDFDPATTVLNEDAADGVSVADVIQKDIAALAERLAKVEDTLADQRTTVGKHGASIRSIGERIDRVAETVGKRIDDLFTQAAAADKANGEALASAHQRIGRLQVHTGADDMNDLSLEARSGFRSMLTRIGNLENLAARRGERLADLERRQELDDHARMDDDGAPPVNLTGIDGLDPVPMEETLQPIQPTHLNGLQREEVLRVKIGQLGGAEVFVAYKIGDEVRLEGATSVTGTLIPDGWYRVAGMMAQPTDNHGHTVQVATTAYTGRVPPLRWVKPGTVKEVRHGNR